jgi:hypothetical protein
MLCVSVIGEWSRQKEESRGCGEVASGNGMVMGFVMREIDLQGLPNYCVVLLVSENKQLLIL